MDTALNNYKKRHGTAYTYFTTAAGTVTYDAAANRLRGVPRLCRRGPAERGLDHALRKL